jgi:hypothetical protein
MIFKDDVVNVYVGRREAGIIIENANFKDAPSDLSVKERLARASAIGALKGYGAYLSPEIAATNEEAAAFILRAAGMEGQYMEAVDSLAMGYTEQAAAMGVITEDVSSSGAITRENAADWLIRGVEIVSPDAFYDVSALQRVYEYADWKDISPKKMVNVEKALSAGVFADSRNKTFFSPKSKVSRGELAAMAADVAKLIYSQKTGVIGGVKDSQTIATGESVVIRDYYIRSSEGYVDILRYRSFYSSDAKADDFDAPVFKNGKTDGLFSLEEGDEIEYVTKDGVCLYVRVSDAAPVNQLTVRGRFVNFDPDAGRVSVTDVNGKEYSFNMISALYGEDFLLFNERKRVTADLPLGAVIEISLKNNVADALRFIGDPAVIDEKRGVVTENNLSMGYLTYMDDDGALATARYTARDAVVRKNGEYVSGMEDIEPGDIVFMRFSAEYPYDITAVSAAGDYAPQRCKIARIVDNGGYSSITARYENGEIASFYAPDVARVVKNGEPANLSALKPGDDVKLVVNRFSPAVKEIYVESGGELIDIIKGRLLNIDDIQNSVTLQAVRRFYKNGWGEYKGIESFKLDDNAEFYKDEKRVSRERAAKYLKRGDVYAAVERGYDGDRIRKMTFRDGRDKTIAASRALLADDVLQTLDARARFDDGTIARRGGRLIGWASVAAGDYVAVALNGHGRSVAVADVMDPPGSDGVKIMCGRVKSLNENDSFTVESISTLENGSWLYSPVERVFATDSSSVFLNEGGAARLDFSAFDVGRDYTIATAGGRAEIAADAAFAENAIYGEIQSLDDVSVSLRDARYLDAGEWRLIGGPVLVSIAPNALIVKNNDVNESELQAGDFVMVMTDAPFSVVVNDKSADGFIVLAES